MKFIWSSIKSQLKKIDIHSLYFLWKSGQLRDDGWFRSFRECVSVDAAGEALPWITYPAIEFLNRRVRPEMSIFEYGCGAGTLWWANRVKEVVACEHNREWYLRMKATVPYNVSIHYINLEYGGAYSKKITDFASRFDIVIIDGRDRVNCSRNALSALKPDGVIIWDNSDREEYSEGYAYLLENGFKRIEFVGMSPSLTMKNETSIFYRDDNCLNI